jgi:hypothetical protein
MVISMPYLFFRRMITNVIDNFVLETHEWRPKQQATN